jgi:Zn-dependent protease
MPDFLPGLTIIDYWVIGAASALILFFSILLHELSHSIVAMRYGIQVRQIVLFIFGGVSDITAELRDYRKEARMAFAGPLTSFILSAGFGLMYWTVAILQIPPFSGAAFEITKGVLYYSAIINLVLGVFNLIPAFPSDGGRLLRAALMKGKKNYDEATKIAANVGIAISYGFMGIGFAVIMSGEFLGGVWIMLLGWFLMSGAQSYLSQIQLSSVLSSFRLSNIMNTNVISVKSMMTVDKLLEIYFRTLMKSAFPVVDDSNRLIGMVTLKRVLDVSEAKRTILTVSDIMIPKSDLVVMTPEDDANFALMSMVKSGTGKIFVCDSDGTLVGIVSKTDILSVEIERKEYVRELKSR